MSSSIRRGKAIRADLALWDGRASTYTRLDASGGTVTGVPIGDEVDVLQVYGSGINRTQAAIAAAIAQIGSSAVTLVFAPGTWTIDANLTIPSNFTCHIPRGCVFSVDSGITLTFSGPIQRESETWYSGSGTVTVTASNNVLLHTADLGLILYPRTTAEISAGVTPTNYLYQPLDARRYGLSTAASAATNSTAIQRASTVAYTAGGGEITLPAGTFSIDTPPLIYETVSIRGAGKNSTILKKTTSTASSVSDSTTRFWDSASVGNPICVLHFVGFNGTDNWSYATCRDIQVQGDTSSPNTSVVVYGLFFRGMTGGRVEGCFAQYTQVGYFWGGGSTITSQIAENTAGNVQRGFYQHFMTSTTFHHNYANKFRYVGYFLSWYYSNIFSNAADNVGSPWKVGTTEISLAYQGNSCRGGAFFGNGCETHNGSVYSFSNCISVRFFSNLALDITSNYTGGSDICLWENSSNNSCVYEDNRLQTTSVTGTGARHFMYKITSELGNYVWQRNRFVAVASDATNTSTWANTSGTITETQAVTVTAGTFTPTIAGSGTAGTTTYGTRSGSYEKIDSVVNFRLRVTWTNQTGAGDIVVGGLPFTAAATDDVPVSIAANGLTYSNQLTGLINANNTTITPYTESTGGALTAVPLDTAATLWISGSYLV